MNILEYIKPSTVHATIKKIIRNQRNLIFYRKTMKELAKSGIVQQYGLRLDLSEFQINKRLFNFLKKPKYLAYYILNLEPEILLMGDESIELEKSRVFESLMVKKAMFENAGLGELIEAKTERIKTDDYYAYLIQIMYKPLTSKKDLLYCISWFASVLLLIYIIITISISYHSSIYSWLINIFIEK